MQQLITKATETIRLAAEWISGKASWLARQLVGEVRWQAPPPWLRLARDGTTALGERTRAIVWRNPRRTAWIAGAAFVAVASGGLAWVWYDGLPKPPVSKVYIKAPERTRLEDPEAKPNPVRITFDASVARLADVGKEVKSGVEMNPSFEGGWKWLDDRSLVFTPKTDWPVDAGFTVKLAKKGLIAEQFLLDRYEVDFRTAPFDVTISNARFYQDPVNSAAKKIVVDVNFSHPVDIADFEKHVTLFEEGKSGGFLGLGATATKFSVSYDKLKLNAYVHSEALSIPAKPVRMDFTLQPGARSSRGGKPLDATLKQTVIVPGLYSLNVNSAQLTHVENDALEPERIVMVNLSEDTHDREVTSKVRAWVLPIFHPDTKPADRKQPYDWGDPSRIGPEILRQSEAIKLEPVAGEREYVAQHGFKARVDAQRYVYIRVEKGIKSFGGYVLEKEFDTISRAEPFPRQLRIGSRGSLLALSGEKKLPVLARDVEAVRYQIGRLMPMQLQHLVRMNSGTFSEPEFAYEFDENITERFNEIVPLPPGPPGKPHYLTLDLARYLEPEGGPRRGIFYIKVESYDPKTKQPTGVEDRRLIVVTDLGLLAKRAVDGTQDVFVQSIATGLPVADAAVEVVAKNGAVLVSRNTDASGRARIPELSAFERERTPVAYVARRGGDSSFLPIDRYDRQLDFSRFDIGGITNSPDAGQLSAYLFSDRRVYRPGEEIHIGMIVRTADWTLPINGLPLEVELTDARGLVLRLDKIRLSVSGFEELRHTTLDTAPVGDYTAAVYIVKDGQRASQIGSVTVKVKEFIPDRLKMTARLSQQVQEGWVSPQQLKAQVNLQNLSGTPAEKRRVSASMTLVPAFPAFPSWRDYQFYDPLYADKSFEQILTDATTDEHGDAAFDLNLSRFARATYRLNFGAQGFEADSGRGVSAEATALVSDLPYLVGYKPDGNLAYVARGSARSVDIVAIDPVVKRIAVKDLRLIQIERRVVSVLTRQDNGTYRYESREKIIDLDDQPFELPVGGRRLVLETATPGNFSYMVRNAQGQDLARIPYEVAGKANLTRSLEKNTELQIRLNKKEFAPGEIIEVSIQAPYAGAGLITIERERVHAHTWFKTSTTASTATIRVPNDFEGNGYVSVSFIRDPSSNEIYTSPLAFGVQPFSVKLDRHTLTTTVTAPDQVKPGDTLRLRCSTDRPARMVIFVVDEGILQVARYKTPDPLGFFFQKRALDVRTTQILDLILPEFKRFMAAAPGGDGEGALAKYLNPFKRKRDKPAVYWSGIIDSNACDLRWQVPDSFNGTLRLMAVAVSANAMGVFEKKIVSRGDFVLSPNAPVTATPGDEFDVSLGVGNNVKGSGAAPAILISADVSPHFEVIGQPSLRLNIAEGHEGVTNFRVRAKDALGSGTLTFTATLAEKSAKIATDVSIRPAQPYFVQLSAGSLRSGNVDAPLTRDLYPEYRKLEGGISAMPLGLAHGLVSYLDNFPYSCTEQLVSMGIPALILADRPEFGELKSKEKQSLEDLLAVLRARQNGEGAFGLWAANAHITDIASVYAMHFLVEAHDRGRAIPADVLANGNNWLRSLAASETTTLEGERNRAYAIYVLTRQGIVTTNYAAAVQKRLETNHPQDYPQDMASAWLAASYQIMKQQSLADRLIGRMEFGAGTTFGPYYDPMTRDAGLLFVLARHFPERLSRLKADALEGLVQGIRGGNYNTHSSATTILALDAYARVAEKQPAGSFSAAEILRDGSSRPLVLPPVLMPRANVTPGSAKVQFTNKSALNGYWFVQESGFDRGLPAKEIKNGIEVLREYVDASGKPVQSAKVGDEIEVRLKLRAIDRTVIENVALVDLLPGGFDLVAPDVAGTPRLARSAIPAWLPDFADNREDRVVVYGSVRNEFQEFVYRIKATNAGTFVVPPAYGESMYEPKIRGRSLGTKITVGKK